MEICPKCHKYSVEYDSYRKANVCLSDGCSCIIIDSSSYSYIKSDPVSKKISRVQVEGDTETKTLKQYAML